ncbi:MAG: glycoside hydrolase family 43 protein [Prevotella sp.]|jgi:arabinoxylan arabinofuranohydrolase
MKRNMKRIYFVLLLETILSTVASAQNPIVQTKFTADPAPVVINDTVFLYTSHDDDKAEGFIMREWLLYTSTDMVNWTDHGAVASLKDFKWAPQDNGAWAPQVIARNGKYYMYCPIHGHGIGVLVADSPYGPFKDALGKPFIHQGWDDIDPTVWIDDDGQAYLYWGNPDLYYVKLNKDMVSYSGNIVKCAVKPEDYQEGPWFYKFKGKYYLAYASTCCPEGIGYAMSDSPLGPWQKTGTIMDHNPKSNGNHPGIINYKGHNYCFGFNYYLSKRQSPVHRERRSVCLAEFNYNADGTIPELDFWDDQKVSAVGTVNPYKRVEAETMAWGEGLKTYGTATSGIYVDSISNGDYIKVRSVDFGSKGSPCSIIARVSSDGNDGSIEVHTDSKEGPLLGTIRVNSTAGKWKQVKASLTGATGIKDLYFVFKGNVNSKALFKFDSWQVR